MRTDVADELAVIRSWRDAFDASVERDATVSGFLWALSLVADVDVTDLRARLDAPRNPADVFRSAPGAPVEPTFEPPPSQPGSWVEPWPDPETAPPWRGLGMARIERTREAGTGPLGRGRAFTSGQDGRPVALEASYAEMAADSSISTRGLSDDTEDPETRGDVPSTATN